MPGSVVRRRIDALLRRQLHALIHHARTTHKIQVRFSDLLPNQCVLVCDLQSCRLNIFRFACFKFYLDHFNQKVCIGSEKRKKRKRQDEFIALASVRGPHFCVRPGPPKSQLRPWWGPQDLGAQGGRPGSPVVSAGPAHHMWQENKEKKTSWMAHMLRGLRSPAFAL